MCHYIIVLLTIDYTICSSRRFISILSKTNSFIGSDSRNIWNILLMPPRPRAILRAILRPFVFYYLSIFSGRLPGSECFLYLFILGGIAIRYSSVDLLIGPDHKSCLTIAIYFRVKVNFYFHWNTWWWAKFSLCTFKLALFSFLFSYVRNFCTRLMFLCEFSVAVGFYIIIIIKH